MSEPFSVRLDQVHGRLCKLVQKSHELLHGEHGAIVWTEEDLKKTYNLLQTWNTQLTSEVHIYMEKCSGASTGKVTECTETQIEAEECIAELKLYMDRMTKNTEVINSKLPRIEIPKFNGDILKFSQFWDRFQANIDKRNLCDADKLAYLLGCLEGSALDMLSGLETTNSNYSIAVQALKKRFGQNDKVIDAHYEAINNMQKADSVSDCRRVFDGIECHLRILKSLGEDIDGNQFRAVILSKFLENMVYELNLMVQGRSMSAIRDRLEHIIMSKEQAQKESIILRKVEEEKGATATALYVRNTKDRKIWKRPEQQPKMPNIRPIKRKQEHSMHAIPKKKSRKECIFCNGDHFNGNCMSVKTIEERKQKLGNRCYNCFKDGHRIRDCLLKKLCYYCKKKHNQALCPQKCKSFININKIKETTCNLTKNNNCFLQTATVSVRGQHHRHKCRLILDSDSQRSYITKRLAHKLNLETTEEDTLMIYVFGSDQPIETVSPSAQIEIITRRGINKTIRVNIVPHITDRIQPPCYLDQFKDIDISADEITGTGQPIDLLIGNDYYFAFLRNNMKMIQENLYLIDSDFGWLLSGQRENEDDDERLTLITYCQYELGSVYHSMPDLPMRETDLKFLWALEALGITDSPKVTREEEAVRHFNQTVKYEGNRYYVIWPWITYPPELPTNFGLAYGRLSSLIRRLERDTIEEYNTILKEQLNSGIIEAVEPQPLQTGQTTSPVHYLAHHIVKQEGKRGRIVYDASAKIKDCKSLNECMYRGPAMLEDLLALLLKFRLNKIGITADVEKAFLQVGLQEEARDVTRFLWLKDISKGVSEDNILHLRFCRVPFGIISSPFILTATIRYHLSTRDNTLLKEIADHCYVDNLVTGCHNMEGALDLIHKTRRIFTELSMNIREWTSNDKQLMKNIPSQYRGKNNEVVKILGLMWNLGQDTLKLKQNSNIFDHEDKSKNKRELLRLLASVYDPCGFAAPLLLPAKLVIQELWKRKIKWDTELPEDLTERYDDALKALKMSSSIELPRYVGKTSTDDIDCELHCFTDASKNAFAAIIYLRMFHKKMRKYNVRMIMAKSRVTPIDYKDDLKVPRLELLGYVIGKRLLCYVQDTLDLPIKRLCLWTDSAIVLCWMKSEKLLPPFVSRRINEIKQKKNIEYRYVDTNQNPADLATRPEQWELKQKLWFYGPKFLQQQESTWPVLQPEYTSTYNNVAALGGLDFNPEKEMDELEERDEMFTDCTPDIDINKLGKQVEIMFQEYKNPPDPELEEVKELQSLHFPDEMKSKETHLTRNLQLFVDTDGLLRCRGRIMNASCPYDAKYPILLPRDCEFTDKLIKRLHEKNHHVGASHTLSIIRQKYWIPQGKAKVQRILKRCPQCVRHGGGPFKLPPAPALPSERVNISAPFTYTGIDYFGPLFVTNNQIKEKRWICLYTCLAVRAIHMEVVKDLTIEECLLAIRRFVSTRGVPELIVSDNALQFKLSAEVLTGSYCTENKIRWKFIPELSPWHGGFYERLIGLVKNSLKRTLEKQSLNDTQLQTIIKEVEAVMNTRPLTKVGADLEYVLRPVDFLNFGKFISITPSTRKECSGTITKQSLIEGWKKGQKILEEFKKMFLSQYLFSLRERYQHSHKQPRVCSKRSPQIGDIVQLKGESKNRENWKTGKISSLTPSADGVNRVARVDVNGKEFIRSLGHLYPLEVEEIPKDEESSTLTEKHIESTSPGDEITIEVAPEPENRSNIPLEEVDESSSTTNPHTSIEDVENEAVKDRNVERTRRVAAQRAREKIAQWTSQLISLL